MVNVKTINPNGKISSEFDYPSLFDVDVEVDKVSKFIILKQDDSFDDDTYHTIMVSKEQLEAIILLYNTTSTN